MLAKVIVGAVAYVAAIIILVLLRRAAGVSPSVRLNLFHVVVVWGALWWLALRVLGLTGRKAAEAEGENTVDKQVGS